MTEKRKELMLEFFEARLMKSLENRAKVIGKAYSKKMELVEFRQLPQENFHLIFKDFEKSFDEYYEMFLKYRKILNN